MINVTCFKCSWSFTVDEEALAESLDEGEAPPRHYVVECPRCRQANKVSLKRRRRRRRSTRGE
jgi:uncharacterized Zn finger protein